MSALTGTAASAGLLDLELDELCLLGPVEARQWGVHEPRYDITAER